MLPSGPILPCVIAALRSLADARKRGLHMNTPTHNTLLLDAVAAGPWPHWSWLSAKMGIDGRIALWAAKASTMYGAAGNVGHACEYRIAGTYVDHK